MGICTIIYVLAATYSLHIGEGAATGILMFMAGVFSMVSMDSFNRVKKVKKKK